MHVSARANATTLAGLPSADELEAEIDPKYFKQQQLELNPDWEHQRGEQVRNFAVLSAAAGAAMFGIGLKHVAWAGLGAVIGGLMGAVGASIKVRDGEWRVNPERSVDPIIRPIALDPAANREAVLDVEDDVYGEPLADAFGKTWKFRGLEDPVFFNSLGDAVHFATGQEAGTYAVIEDSQHHFAVKRSDADFDATPPADRFVARHAALRALVTKNEGILLVDRP